MTQQRSAHQQLAATREEVTKVELRLDEVRLEKQRAERAADKAEAALAAYFSELEGGSKPDRRREKDLRLALQEARDAAGVEWDARERAVLQRLSEAQQAVAAFAANHADDLAAELMEEAPEARDRLLRAVEELNAAEAHWNDIRARWVPIVERRGLNVRELPQSPLHGATGEIATALAPNYSGKPRHPSRLLPVPWSFLPADERPESSPVAPVEQDGVVRTPILVGAA
jgi:hypothetical protein